MGIFDNETYLPGVITEIESDYSYGYDTSLFGTTDSVLIIGTAFDGKTGEIIPVYSPEHGAYLFGKSYDAKTKREASLVAGIQDAWERGCKTIYAVRVGGIDLYKDFDFCIDSNYKLRVSAATPSNIGKQTYIKFENTSGLETIKIYKPAARATIAEKMQGLVSTENEVLVTELRLNQDYGISKDSKLTELIKLVNEHQYNNVLKLSIIDENNVDITNSIESYDLSVGAMYPGVYFIGRDTSNCTSITNLKFNLIENEMSNKPYSSFDGVYFRKLIINTDVAQPLPIYSESIKDLRDILRDVNISMVKDFDFLETAGLADRAFVPNNKDYEEVDLSNFEIYKRLGSGFAITATAERRVNGEGNEITPRVKESAMDDANRIVAIKNGIYSMLENAAIKYRVLSCVSADDTVSGKLPRPSDFEKAIAEEIEVLDGLVKVTAKVDPSDRTSAKEYNFQFTNLSNIDSDDFSDIYTDSVMPIIASISSISDLINNNIKPGTYVMQLNASGDGTLLRIGESSYETLDGVGLVGEAYIVNNNIYVGETNGTSTVFKKAAVVASTGNLATYDNKEYVLGENLNNVFVMQIVQEVNGETLRPLGDLKTMLSTNDEKSLVYAKSNNFEANEVLVRSAIFDATTLEEFVEFMNQHQVLGKLFTFELTEIGSEKKDEYVSDAAVESLTAETIYNMAIDKKIGWDYSMYIPYRTTDNFARQLAQHCTYTELKTYPTHGIIGCKRISDISINSVANKVDQILDKEFDMYAKNDYGRNMLDRQNMPYPIGRNISITLIQYYVNIDDGYLYTSNGASGYAGMLSILPLEQSSTNQTIEVTSTQNQLGLTNYQLIRLTSKGIVTLKQSFTKGIVVTDGVTIAPVDSVFRRLSAIRIAGAVEDLIRQAGEPFVGKQNHVTNRNSLHTAIESALNKIVGTLIEKYEFNMIVDMKAMKFSYIDIDYNIVPIYEIREIRNRISMKDQL